MHQPHRQRPIIGIVGAGQLARMTLQAAIPLDVVVHLLAEHPHDGAALVAPSVTVGSPDDPEAVARFAQRCDVLTFDHELVPGAVLSKLDHQRTTLRPSSATMAIAQNKARQRALFAEAGLPIPAFALPRTDACVEEFGEGHGWPLVIKSATGGYDGRGVWIASDLAEARLIVNRLRSSGIQPLLERFVRIDRELALLVARRPGGAVAVYPLVETVQIEGICQELLAPAPVESGTAESAVMIGERVAALTGVEGMLAVELFLSDGALLVNEIATRPHNSGHFTIEGCQTSQFEQHLRAILDWPLGSTELTAAAVATVNVLGNANGNDPADNLPAALGIPGVHIHLYGKSPRAGRKLGHVTATGSSIVEVRDRAWSAVQLLTGGGPEA